MEKLFYKYCFSVLSIYLVSLLISTVYLKSVYSLLFVGLILLIINLVLRPILLIIVLPINLLTFGLCSVVVNALTVMIADAIVPGVDMGGFFNSLLVALLIVGFNGLLMDLNQVAHQPKCN